MYFKAFGFMDLENQIPANTDMVGDISDVTKLITSHVALALHCDPELTNPGSITGPKEFKFEIFDTIRDYMPRYGPDRVTENWEKVVYIYCLTYLRFFFNVFINNSVCKLWL